MTAKHIARFAADPRYFRSSHVKHIAAIVIACGDPVCAKALTRSKCCPIHHKEDHKRDRIIRKINNAEIAMGNEDLVPVKYMHVGMETASNDMRHTAFKIFCDELSPRCVDLFHSHIAENLRELYVDLVLRESFIALRDIIPLCKKLRKLSFHPDVFNEPLDRIQNLVKDTLNRPRYPGITDLRFSHGTFSFCELAYLQLLKKFPDCEFVRMPLGDTIVHRATDAVVRTPPTYGEQLIDDFRAFGNWPRVCHLEVGTPLLVNELCKFAFPLLNVTSFEIGSTNQMSIPFRVLSSTLPNVEDLHLGCNPISHKDLAVIWESFPHLRIICARVTVDEPVAFNAFVGVLRQMVSKKGMRDIELVRHVRQNRDFLMYKTSPIPHAVFEAPLPVNRGMRCLRLHHFPLPISLCQEFVRSLPKVVVYIAYYDMLSGDAASLKEYAALLLNGFLQCEGSGDLHTRPCDVVDPNFYASTAVLPYGDRLNRMKLSVSLDFDVEDPTGRLAACQFVTPLVKEASGRIPKPRRRGRS